MHQPESPADPLDDRDPEAPEADFAEQHSAVLAEDEENDSEEVPVELPLDADPADVSEQARSVEYDDDDYR
jgi:hypothetical protein